MKFELIMDGISLGFRQTEEEALCAVGILQSRFRSTIHVVKVAK